MCGFQKLWYETDYWWMLVKAAIHPSDFRKKHQGSEAKGNCATPSTFGNNGNTFLNFFFWCALIKACIRAGHGVDPERIWSGYPAIFLGSGADLNLKFFLKPDPERSRIWIFLERKILVNDFLLYFCIFIFIKFLWSNIRSHNDFWRYLDDPRSYICLSLLCLFYSWSWRDLLMLSRINNLLSTPPRAGWFLTQKIYCRLSYPLYLRNWGYRYSAKKSLGRCLST